MISTRRIVAAVGLAAGITALAAPMASASDSAISNRDGSELNPLTLVDSLATTGVPADRQAEMPRPSEQLDRLNNLHQLDQVAQMGAVATALPGAVVPTGVAAPPPPGAAGTTGRPSAFPQSRSRRAADREGPVAVRNPPAGALSRPSPGTASPRARRRADRRRPVPDGCPPRAPAPRP